MRMAVWPFVNHYLSPLEAMIPVRLWSNPLAMVPVSTYGLDNKHQVESGLDLTGKSCVTKSLSTSIRRTSGPNTITIRTTLSPRKSSETTSNTTSLPTSTDETASGISKVTELTSSQQWTSPTPSERKLTTQPSQSSESTGTTTTTSSTSTGSRRTKTSTTSTDSSSSTKSGTSGKSGRKSRQRK